MKIEPVTRQLVRPAKDDQESRKWVALSTADLLLPPVYVDCLLAYEAPAPPTSDLREALAKALCGYHEFAGRMEQALPAAGFWPAIVLNDAGAAFIEAVADVPLSHLQSSFQSLSDLTLRDLVAPHPLRCSSLTDQELLLVQVTRFACGGVTIGFTSHHRVADGVAAFQFMHAWALTNKGITPPFSSSQDRSFMMARDPPQPTFDDEDFKWPLLSRKTRYSEPLAVPLEKQGFAVRKLYFSAQFLQELKQEAAKSGSGSEEYSKFESLTAHLWRCITRARGLNIENMKDMGENGDLADEGEGNITRVIVPVNVRNKMNSPTGNGYFGNAVCRMCTSAQIEKLIEEPLGYAATLVKVALKRMTEEYVRSSLDFVTLKKRDTFESGNMNGSSGLSPNVFINSWASALPFSNLDFGTGIPVYAGNILIPTEGLVLILPPLVPGDGGLYVALGLFETAMENFLSFYGSIF